MQPNSQFVGGNVPNNMYIQPVAKSNGGKVAKVVLSVVLGLMIVGLSAFAVKINVLDKKPSTLNQDVNSQVKGINTDAFMAVFMTNGQVYFGHIIENTDTELKLQDVYFLRVDQAPLDNTQGKDAAASQQPVLTILERSKSLHSPVDPMTINKSSVMLYEPLSGDSQVIKAINDIKNGKKEQ